MRRRPAVSQRERDVERLRGKLERDSYPRLQMLLLVTLTGAAGFLASFLLLLAGLQSMWLRYPASIAVAYLAFLFLLWLWLRWSGADIGDGGLPDLAPSGRGSDAACSGEGGSFDGGGASADFEPPGDGVMSDVSDTALEAVGSAEELLIPLALLVAICAAIGTAIFMMFSVVASAPLLFAELLVDGLLSASLYRRLRGLDRAHWIEPAIRRTGWGFLAAALTMAIGGAVLTLYAPGAHSIGEVIASKRAPR
ncbi:hypothetical protein [Massilia pseudoviolaceinigra]|uniref:hypothetical protein n=1 Tax=Massilia pseudoviolaceinigra TaxID=3057165 RepID=UPI002796E17C|nr:hypothetical protein [Massilia sp. CCM 9206]MDQ1922194.1 hypothetical protein [Massilia sp. CCM 9206]